MLRHRGRSGREIFHGGLEMRIRVECYSGYKADERPVRFHLGERQLRVQELLDRWYGQAHDYFKLLADDGNVYILRHERMEDFWELTMFSKPDAPPRSTDR
jgi:hypothetical protein